jgi:hypothetical protein
VTVIMGAFDGGLLDCPVDARDLTLGPGMLVVQGCLILVRRWALPFSRQRMSNMWMSNIGVMSRAVRPSAARGGNVNGTPVAVRTVSILSGTAAIRACKKAKADVRPVLFTNCPSCSPIARRQICGCGRWRHKERAWRASLEGELARGGLNRGAVEMTIADRIALKLSRRGRVPFALRAAADLMPLPTAMPG